jgi:hypothetical protein
MAFTNQNHQAHKWTSTAASPTAHWRQLAQALAHVLPGECFPAAVTQIVVEYARRVVAVACNNGRFSVSSCGIT